MEGDIADEGCEMQDARDERWEMRNKERWEMRDAK